MIHLIMSLLQRHESTLDQSDSIDQKEFATKADNDWSHHWTHHSIVSLLEQHLKSNSVTNLSLFASSMIYLYSQHWQQQQDDIYCRQNETCTIYLERIEHILHVWNHEDMSWNLFIIEYLKLNRKNLLEW